MARSPELGWLALIWPSAKGWAHRNKSAAIRRIADVMPT